MSLLKREKKLVLRCQACEGEVSEQNHCLCGEPPIICGCDVLDQLGDPPVLTAGEQLCNWAEQREAVIVRSDLPRRQAREEAYARGLSLVVAV